MRKSEIKKQFDVINVKLERIETLLIEIMKSSEKNLSLDSTALLDEYLNGAKK